MIINGNFCPETHTFKTAEAARAFCRVHTGFCPVTCGDAGYAATSYVTHQSNLGYCINAVSGISRISATNQLEISIRECKLSYKNLLIAGTLGSLMGTKYRMGRGEEKASSPIIFTYGIGCAAPTLTLLFLLSSVMGIVLGTFPRINMLCLALVYLTVEVLIPWVNSHSVDPIAEPWMIPKQLTDMKNED